MLRSDLCDYSDAYIVVRGAITVESTFNANGRNYNLTFKNNAPFSLCILKTNTILIDNTEDLMIVIPMYNLLEHTDDYSMTSGHLWHCHRGEMNDDANENNPAGNYRIDNS